MVYLRDELAVTSPHRGPARLLLSLLLSSSSSPPSTRSVFCPVNAQHTPSSFFLEKEVRVSHGDAERSSLRFGKILHLHTSHFNLLAWKHVRRIESIDFWLQGPVKSSQ